MPSKTTPRKSTLLRSRNNQSTKLDRKGRGEWAEIEFLSRTYNSGFIVSRPWGDNAPYDFIVQRRRRLHRIQVKSVWSLRRKDYRYNVRISRAQHLPYHPRAFEFLAIYVVPEDVWYIIPLAAVRHKLAIALFAHHEHSRGQFEKYREAWHLLK